MYNPREENIHKINDVLINLSRRTPNDSIYTILLKASDCVGCNQRITQMTNEQILEMLTKYYKLKD